MSQKNDADVRYFIDCVRNLYGHKALYDDMSKEERKAIQNENRKLNAKPYSSLSEEEKEKKREYVRAWRRQQKQKSQQLIT